MTKPNRKVTQSNDQPKKSGQLLVSTFLLLALAACQSTSTRLPGTGESAASNSFQTAATSNLTPAPIDSEQTSTNPLTASIWRGRLQPLFEKARYLVESNTGADLSEVRLNLTADQRIAQEVSFETNRLVQNQFDNKAFAKHFLNAVMAGQQGTFAALYATRRNEVMISESLLHNYEKSLPNDPYVQDSALLALLIHELVHAADDKRFNIHDNRELNFRASFAQSAAFEGHAQYVTRNICSEHNCLSGLQALDYFMFGKSNPPNQLTQSVQAISRNVLEYSYVEGERFITNLATRPNGKELIAQLLSSPPQDPIQILDPDSYPNTNREQQNQKLIRASQSFDHPWLQKPWTQIQTSPLKGVNLRADPERRNAAVDGFTRLIKAMVALQLYDQSSPAKSPIELTVLHAESNQTAQLFSESLHNNTVLPETRVFRDRMKISTNGAAKELTVEHYITVDTAAHIPYVTLIAFTGKNVVQIAGSTQSMDLFSDYANKLLAALHADDSDRLAKVGLRRR